ncbi:MAG: oxidoreductase [Melioribacteraceae bacterium]|nr:MAG: oxidoreductase [Melioribacteraceae bacterium]
MNKLKIGIIGLGRIAQLVHIPIIAKLPNAELEGICDTDKNKLKHFGEKYKISKKYRQVEDLLNDESIEAVIIATPTNTHRDISVKALNAGKHILIEKPGATSVVEMEDIEKASIENNRIAMVGMNQRFRPDSMLIKSLINSGDLGEIFYIRTAWLHKKSSEQSWFLDKRLSGGGVLLDLGISLIDLALWFLEGSEATGGAVQIFNHRLNSVEDSAAGLIKLNKSAISFEVSWSLFSEKEQLALTLYGTEGTAHLNPFKAYKKMGSTRIDLTGASPLKGPKLFNKSYENEIKHFAGAVIGNNPVLSSISEAKKTMGVMENLYLLANDNK